MDTYMKFVECVLPIVAVIFLILIFLLLVGLLVLALLSLYKLIKWVAKK